MSMLGEQLELSKSQIHYSVKRCIQVGLLGEKTLYPKVEPMKELVEHAIKFIFPPEWKGEGKGMATAHSTEPLSELIRSNGVSVIWEEQQGDTSGSILKPIHPSVPSSSRKDRQLYECFALIDAVRSGRIREKKLALDELLSRIEARRAKFE